MKWLKNKLYVFVLFMSLFPMAISAQTAPALKDESFLRITQEVQKCRESIILLGQYKEALDSLNERIEVMQKEIDSDEKLIDLYKQKDEINKQLIAHMKMTIEIMMATSEKALKDAKPGLLDTAKTMSIGAVIALLIKSLLLF